MRKLIFICSLFASFQASAMTLTINFPNWTPKTFDFSYAVSTGICKPGPTYNCNNEANSMAQVDPAHVNDVINALKAIFSGFSVPVVDPTHKPTNFVELQAYDNKGKLGAPCHANIQGKKSVTLTVSNKGVCTVVMK